MANTRRGYAPRWWTTAWGSDTELWSKSNAPYGSAASIIRFTLSDGTNTLGALDAPWNVPQRCGGATPTDAHDRLAQALAGLNAGAVAVDAVEHPPLMQHDGRGEAVLRDVLDEGRVDLGHLRREGGGQRVGFVGGGHGRASRCCCSTGGFGRGLVRGGKTVLG